MHKPSSSVNVHFHATAQWFPRWPQSDERNRNWIFPLFLSSSTMPQQPHRGKKKFKPGNAIELKSVRHCSAHKLYIHWWLQNFLRSEQKPLCCIVLRLVAWTETPLGWVTERLNWKRSIQRHVCRKSSHRSFITNVGFWYLLIILHEF